MYEARVELIASINHRIRQMNQSLPADKQAMADLVAEQVELHRRSLLPHLSDKRVLGNLIGRSPKRISEWLGERLRPEDFAYWKRQVHRQTHLHTLFDKGSDRARNASARSSRLSNVSTKRRQEISQMGRKAYEEKYGPAAQEVLYPLFLRGLSNRDISMFTPYTAEHISTVRVVLKNNGTLGAGERGPQIRPQLSFPPSKIDTQKLTLLQGLYEQGFYGTNLQTWNLLNDISKQYAELAQPTIDLLRLEVFFAALAHNVRGNTEPLEKYLRVVRKLGFGWIGAQIADDRLYLSRAKPYILGNSYAK